MPLSSPAPASGDGRRGASYHDDTVRASVSQHFSGSATVARAAGSAASAVCGPGAVCECCVRACATVRIICQCVQCASCHWQWGPNQRNRSPLDSDATPRPATEPRPVAPSLAWPARRGGVGLRLLLVAPPPFATVAGTGRGQGQGPGPSWPRGRTWRMVSAALRWRRRSESLGTV